MLARRNFLRAVGAGGAATATACTVGETVPSTSGAGDVDAWETRAAQLETASGVLYSATNEGIWAGKAGSHVATAVRDADGSATASCTHVMVDAAPTAEPPVAQHWVTTIYVRDAATDRVIHLAEFVTRGPDAADVATTTFELPTGITRVRVYAYCNQHDLWVSEEIELG